MALKLYFDYASPPARATYFTIKYLDIPVKLMKINLFQGEVRSEDYLKINPMGRIPSIDDNGFILSDSHAINIYLVTKYGKDDKLYPSDVKKRAVVNQRLFFDADAMFPAIRNTTRSIAFDRLTSPSEYSIKTFLKCYKLLEGYLHNNQFVAGNDMTIADFSLLSSVITANLYCPVKKENFPLLTDYLDRGKSWKYYEAIITPGIEAAKDFLRIKNIVCPQ